MKKAHYVATDLAWETACGRSTHGWQGPRTPVTTTDHRQVDCTRCRKALATSKTKETK